MQKRPSVLVVDDEVRGLELAQRILRRTAEVVVSEDGEQALERLATRDFDIVISDQRMPGISGVELLTQVSQNAPQTGRILLTGYADMEATVDAINQAAVHAYLHKPCPPDHFRLTVQTVLDRMQTVREHARLADQQARVGGLRPALDELVSSVHDLVEIVEPGDDATTLRVKRAAEANLQVEQILGEEPDDGRTSD